MTHPWHHSHVCEHAGVPTRACAATADGRRCLVMRFARRTGSHAQGWVSNLEPADRRTAGPGGAANQLSSHPGREVVCGQMVNCHGIWSFELSLRVTVSQINMSSWWLQTPAAQTCTMSSESRTIAAVIGLHSLPPLNAHCKHLMYLWGLLAGCMWPGMQCLVSA